MEWFRARCWSADQSSKEIAEKMRGIKVRKNSSKACEAKICESKAKNSPEGSDSVLKGLNLKKFSINQALDGLRPRTYSEPMRTLESTSHRCTSCNGDQSGLNGRCLQTSRSGLRLSLSSAPASLTVPVYRILLLGRSAVGKSAILAQLTRNDSYTRVDYDNEEQVTLAVTVDCREVLLHIQVVDIKACSSLRHVDAFVIVFSVDDSSSFFWAASVLSCMRQEPLRSAAVILLGNKKDLQNSRIVLEEDARQIASRYDTHYLELSALLGDRVDSLLLAIVGQVEQAQARLANRERRQSKTKVK